jgi:GNAT superfamily N-acetyltransferase
MRVERARADDAAAVHALYEEAAAFLTARGLRQWLPGAWTSDAISQAIARGEIFVARSGSRLAALLSLVDEDLEIWGASDGTALYLHKLTVARASASEGLGRRLLDWVADEARRRGRLRVRLDCVASNTFLRRYYAAAGFAECGEVDLARVRLARFERRLTPRP